MEIVERREHDGQWWGRDRHGSWRRWNAAVNGWEGPLAPPWPPPESPHPGEAAIVARALATSGGGPPPPTNPVDAWWNRHFPPFSVRRLVFGLVALPVVAALTELVWIAAGRDPSLPRYLFVSVAGGAMLATAWLPGMRELAERMRSSGAFDTGSRWPWRWGRELPPAPPLPPLRETFGRDFLVALPFAAVIVLVIGVTVAGLRETFTPGALLTGAVAAIASAVTIALRTSVWGLVIVSLAGGLLGGLGMVFLSLMTFSDVNLGDILIGWALGSALVFAYAYPWWRRLRDLEARGFRFPLWIVMGGSALLVSGAALVFLAER